MFSLFLPQIRLCRPVYARAVSTGDAELYPGRRLRTPQSSHLLRNRVYQRCSGLAISSTSEKCKSILPVTLPDTSMGIKRRSRGKESWIQQLVTTGGVLFLCTFSCPGYFHPAPIAASVSIAHKQFASTASTSPTENAGFTRTEFLSYRFRQVCVSLLMPVGYQVLGRQVMSMQMFGKICAVMAAAIPIVFCGGLAYKLATGRDLRSTLFKIYSVTGAIPGASAVVADNSVGLFICSLAFFAGKFTIAVVIGIVCSDITAYVKAVNLGNFQIIEEGHMVILNTNGKLRPVLQQIAMARKERGTFRCPIVILDDQDKRDLDNLVARAAVDLDLEISTRTGCTHDVIDLKRVSIGRARCIIWLEPDENEIAVAARRAAAIASIKSLGAGNNRDVRMIVQTSQDSAKSKDQLTHVALAYQSPPLTDNNKLRVVEVYEEENLDRFLAQCALQPNLSRIMMDIFQHNEGKEFYITEKPEFCGMPYGVARRHFHNAIVCGIYSPSTQERGRGEKVELNPSDDTVINDGDRLVVLSSDRWHCQPENTELPKSGAWIESIKGHVTTSGSHDIVVLCFGTEGIGDSGLLEALCHFAEKDTRVTVVSGSEDEKEDYDRKFRISYIKGNPKSYTTLQKLKKQKIDSVIFVGLEDLPPKIADAQLLSSLIQIQEVAHTHWDDKTGFNIVTSVQLSDTKLVANHIIEEGKRAYRVPIDLDIVSQADLASGVLVQVAGFPQLDTVFKDLLNESGTEIYIRNAGEYGLVGRGIVHCYEVSDVVRRFGETFLGVFTQNKEFAIGPDAMSGREYTATDKIVVLAKSSAKMSPASLSNRD